MNTSDADLSNDSIYTDLVNMYKHKHKHRIKSETKPEHKSKISNIECDIIYKKPDVCNHDPSSKNSTLKEVKRYMVIPDIRYMYCENCGETFCFNVKFGKEYKIVYDRV